MSITVVANSSATPPRFEISIATPDGSAATAVTLSRLVYGVTTPTRVQPTTGPSPRVVNDYEAPWGVPVYYTASVTHGGTTETYTAGAQTLSPVSPWAIHPTTPALSVCLDTGSFAAMGVLSIGSVTRAATTTAHEIVGAKFRQITKSGPRAAPRTSLQVATVTGDEQAALIALIDDQTPILIRVPAAYGWGWEDGYYDIGEVSEERVLQYGPEQRRTFTLPLERVEAPAGTQAPERTYADLLHDFASYNATSLAYADYTALLTDTRSGVARSFVQANGDGTYSVSSENLAIHDDGTFTLTI